jgi:hypothetical protein
MDGRDRGRDMGALVFAAILLFVGSYYLLRNTLGFDLGELDGDRIWPVIVIAIGASILLRAIGRPPIDHRP